MKLNLKKPLVFKDLETTGTSVTNDRIIEIAMFKIYPEGHREDFHFLIDPGIPIPPESSAVHGITNEQVFGKNKFKDVAPLVISFLDGSDIAGYNHLHFDVPLLMTELSRCGLTLDISDTKFVDVMRIERLLRPNDLSSVYHKYTGKVLDAHKAEADIEGTLAVLLGQLKTYSDHYIKIGKEEIQFSNDIDIFHKISMGNNVDLSGKIKLNDQGHYVFTFGKHKDKTLQSVWQDDKKYFGWIYDSDFGADTKQKLKEITAGF